MEYLDKVPGVKNQSVFKEAYVRGYSIYNVDFQLLNEWEGCFMPLQMIRNDIDHHLVFQQKFADGIDCNLQSLVFWIAVNAGGNQRKGHRLTTIFFCQVQRCPIAGFQKLLLPMPAIPPARTDCMDHIFAGQAVSLCNFCTAGFAAMQRTAFCKQFRSGRTMNAAIHTAAAQKGRVAALTIASTFIFVISFLIICNGMKHTSHSSDQSPCLIKYLLKCLIHCFQFFRRYTVHANTLP